MISVLVQDFVFWTCSYRFHLEPILQIYNTRKHNLILSFIQGHCFGLCLLWCGQTLALKREFLYTFYYGEQHSGIYCFPRSIRTVQRTLKPVIRKFLLPHSISEYILNCNYWSRQGIVSCRPFLVSHRNLPLKPGASLCIVSIDSYFCFQEEKFGQAK